MTRPALVLAATVLMLVAGCATGPAPVYGPTPPPPPPAGGTAPPPPPVRVPPPPSPLVVEQRWLEQWFGGTPVVIGMQGDSVLKVEVPLVHAFDSERSTVKPALAAVLDRVAVSLVRQQGTRVAIAAPGPSTALALARAASVREHLQGKGVRPHRISSSASPPDAPVSLQVSITPTPISRLDDRHLPPPGAGPTRPAKR